MKKAGTVILLIMVAMTSIGCTVAPSLTPASTQDPGAASTSVTASDNVSITMVEPVAVVAGTGDVKVVVQVSGLDMVDKIGQASVSGQGHIKYSVHADSPGAVPVDVPGGYIASAATSYVWKGLVEGVYTFSAELVNNDNSPLIPPVVAVKQVTVFPG